jgi:peptidoglycan/LPS O-acetylase OafA/YrhL
VEPLRHQQFPLLDSLRALAALSILVVHVSLFSRATENDVVGPLLAHLDIGVPFFFLLSAFLLYRPFVAADVEGMPRTPFLAYAKRRFVRIAPAYWLALTVGAIVPGFIGAFTGDWWAYYGLLQSFPVFTPDPACTASPYNCGIPVAWSLTIEVGFYILLPFFVLAMAALRRRFPRPRWLALELWAVLVLTVVSVVILGFYPDTDLLQWLFFSPFGRGWWFGLGIALAALSVWAATQEREPGFVGALRAHPWPPLVLAAALYVAGSYAMEDSLLSFPLTTQVEFVAQYLLVGAIAALVLLPAVFGSEGDDLPRRILANPVLTWLGLVSYGIFLWQFPVMVGLVDLGLLDGSLPDFPLLLVATLAGTIVCAAASYYALERPLMRWVRGRRRGGDSGESGRVAGADDVPAHLRSV